jgi:probable F420-dependent oxidoreductase
MSMAIGWPVASRRGPAVPREATLRFTVQYPLAVPGYTSDFLDGEAMARFARAAEQAGFSALAFTDHPAPSDKWIKAGGHDSFHMTTALGYCAAVTSTIRLMPYALVLPFRNPFLVAKEIATLDTISGGRVILAAAVGYLRSEFLALGVEFDERNDLFDEAIETIRGTWAAPNYKADGRHFRALGQTPLPVPAQLGGVPIWIAGNSARARRRAVETGQGWAPLQLGAERAATIRTAALPTVADVAAAIGDVREQCERAGRDPATLEIQLEGPETKTLVDGGSLSAHADALRELGEIGVGWFVIDTPADSVDAAVDALQAYGEQVIAPLR